VFHLIYVSSASQPFTKLDLLALLEKARKRNIKRGVTGMLLYKDGNFMQALEGEQEVVRKLAGAIERDPRHKDFLVLMHGTSKRRLFSDWSMGFRDLAELDAANTPGYSDFMNVPLTGAGFLKDSNSCMRMLLFFKENM